MANDERVRKALEIIEQCTWASDFKPVLVKHVTKIESNGGLGDLSDPTLIARRRDPGPMPAQSPGLSFSERTISNMAGDHEIPVRIYRPDTPSPLRPAFIMYHGGGLSFGHLNTEHTRCVDATRACGAVGISVGFRMAPDHPASVVLDDGYSALKWATDHAAELDIDPRRIAITGGSGGGLMTLAVAQLARDRADTKPLLQIALYPNTDDRAPPHFVSRHKSLPIISAKDLDDVMANLKAHEKDPEYVLANRTKDVSRLCPAVIVVAGNDPLRDEGIEYAQRLIHADVPTELHVLPGVAHGFDLIAPDCAATKQAYGLMNDAFMRAAAEI